jgi:hypothetical protein
MQFKSGKAKVVTTQLKLRRNKEGFFLSLQTEHGRVNTLTCDSQPQEL